MLGCVFVILSMFLVSRFDITSLGCCYFDAMDYGGLINVCNMLSLQY